MDYFFKFKTLQARSIVLLLIPVFLILFLSGVISFFYTRNIMLNQWNESAELKLQRAAHHIAMRISKPIELLDLLFKKSDKEKSFLSSEQIIAFLGTMEGVLGVDFKNGSSPPFSRGAVQSKPGRMQMMPSHQGMRFHRSRISKISNPEYDTDKGYKVVTISLSLSGTGGKDMGTLGIRMSFDYLLKDIIKLGWWQSDMACIVDQAGKYIAHTNMTMIGRNYLGDGDDPLENTILEKMIQHPFGMVNSQGYPPRRIAGFYKLDQLPWTMILYARGDKILNPIIIYRNAFALGSLVLIFVIIMLIRFHVGSIVNHIKLLSDKARKVAKGEYGTPIPVDSEDEMGRLIISYNEMVKGLEERDFIRNSFGRYVDPEFARVLLEHPEAGRLGGERREVVMMMSDIRGFTALSETLSPEIIVRVLNRYFSLMIAIIQEHRGIIVDFFGDAILVFFDPLSETLAETTSRCIRCAQRMQDQMSAFNQSMGEEDLPELAMGIGINSGQVIVGNIGSQTRSKYGIVGSAVNITSRIQAKAYKHEIVISEAVYAHVKGQILVKNSFYATLKGVEQPLQVHRI